MQDSRVEIFAFGAVDDANSPSQHCLQVPQIFVDVDVFFGHSSFTWFGTS